MVKKPVLSEGIKKYFSDRKEYVPQLYVTYGDIFGHNSDLKYPMRSDSLTEDPENPIIDITSMSRKAAEAAVKTVLYHLYNTPLGEIAVLGRYAMMSGKTTPIKVKSMHYGEVEKTTYFKRLNWERFFGQELYCLLSGREPLDFVFSDNVYADEEAGGILKQERMKTMNLEKDERYLCNLVRLEVMAELLSIDDLGNPFNTNIDNDMKIHLFDLDEAFRFRRYNLLEGVKGIEQLCIPIEEIMKDERNLILRRADKERDRILHLISLMKSLSYRSEEAEMMGFENMGQYVEFMLNSFRSLEQA